MPDMEIARFRRRLEACRARAEQARMQEVAALWRSLAESYQFLLTRAERQAAINAPIRNRPVQ
jgi:hypothetical protein